MEVKILPNRETVDFNRYGDIPCGDFLVQKTKDGPLYLVSWISSAETVSRKFTALTSMDGNTILVDSNDKAYAVYKIENPLKVRKVS